MEEKIEQKVSSNGRIVIPKKWRNELKLTDGTIIELEYDGKTIKILKKEHPFEDCIGTFDDFEFTEKDHEEAKKSIWGD